jgi:hypothetical protein
MTEKTPQESLQEAMSKKGRKKAGRLIKPTVAEMIHARGGGKEQKRDAMRSIISGGEPTSGVAASIGKTRRLKRSRRSK